ncbi:MAG TPA: hypothetical protein VF919_03340 [Gemmatimonadales bacterium]
MTDDHDLPIHASFLQSVASPEVKDLAMDFAELTLDAITDDETLKAIPLVRTLVALKGVRERFMLKKTYRFFACLGQIPQEEREKHIRSIQSDPRRARQIGESFAVWLDRLDDEEKAEMLAKVFELYAGGVIDFDRSARFAGVIDRAHLPYLFELRNPMHTRLLRGDNLTSHLLALGLLKITARQSDVSRQLRLGRASSDVELMRIELNEDGIIFRAHVIQGTPVKQRVTETIHRPTKPR